MENEHVNLATEPKSEEATRQAGPSKGVPGEASAAKDDLIVVRVSGEPFDVPLAELEPHPFCVLLAAARSARRKGQTERGHALVEFPRDVQAFRLLRHYLATGEALVPPDPLARQILHTEAAFYGFDELQAFLTSNPELQYFGIPGTGPGGRPAPSCAAKPAALGASARSGWACPSDEAAARCGLAVPGQPSPSGERAPYWTQGARASAAGPRDELLTEEDSRLRAQELAARAAFGGDLDGTSVVRQWAEVLLAPARGAVPICGRSALPYSLLTRDGERPGFGLGLGYVDRWEDFSSNFRAFTLGLDDDLFAGLPLVAAGGSVVAALHYWPPAPVPSAGLVLGWRGAFEAEFARICDDSEAWPPRPRQGGGLRRYQGGRRARVPEPDGAVQAQLAELVEKLRALEGDPLPEPLTAEEHAYLGRLVRMSGAAGLQEIAAGKMEFLLLAPFGSAAQEGPRLPVPCRASSGESSDEAEEVFSSNFRASALGPGAKGGAETPAWPAEAELASESGSGARGEQPTSAFASMSAADIDLFLVTRDPDAALRALVVLHARLHRRFGAALLVFRTEHSVTFAPPRPYKHIQVVLRLYHSPEHVILGFDLDCCAVYFDGQRVVALPRAVRALRSKYNLVDATRQSTTYEARLFKYALRGFDIAIPYGLDIAAAAREVRRRMERSAATREHLSLRGLEVLLAMFEAKRGRSLLTRQLGVPASDYSALSSYPRTEIRLIQAVRRAARTARPLPYAGGTDLAAVLFRAQCSDGRETCAADVPQRVSFQVEAPHVQDRVDLLFTGSFHPVAAAWLPPAPEGGSKI
jgi:hypothetical protein